jgi:hypothetical protein
MSLNKDRISVHTFYQSFEDSNVPFSIFSNFSSYMCADGGVAPLSAVSAAAAALVLAGDFRYFLVYRIQSCLVPKWVSRRHCSPSWGNEVSFFTVGSLRNIAYNCSKL